MQSGDKKPLFGKNYLIRNHFWVNFGPKRTKIDPIFVNFGSYWMLISMVKMILVVFLHEDGHRNQMMAISCLKTSFLRSENHFFNCFEKKFSPRFFFLLNYKYGKNWFKPKKTQTLCALALRRGRYSIFGAIAHCVKWILNVKSKIPFLFLDIRCIFVRQTTFHLEDCPKPMSFFVNTI